MSPGSLVLNPHFLCSKTDTSVLRKGRRTSTNQKNPPVKARVPLAGCWICCEWWAQWAGGKGKCSETSSQMGRQCLALIFTCQKGPLCRNYCKQKLWTSGTCVSSAATVEGLVEIPTGNKWKCAQLGAHGVQAQSSQLEQVLLFCTVQLEWGSRPRQQVSYLQRGVGRPGREQRERRSLPRAIFVQIMSLFRNIHEVVHCLYFKI